MIIAVPFPIYSSEYIFYKIHSNNVSSSRFIPHTQSFFPVTYSTEDIVISGLHVLLDTDIDIIQNLERIETELIQEFSYINTNCERKIKSEWEEFIKHAVYTDKIVLTCKGLSLRDGMYSPKYTIKSVTA